MSTSDPGLRLTSGGMTVTPREVTPGRVRFELGGHHGDIRLVSRSAMLGDDRRRLGVAVRAIAFYGETTDILLHFDDPALAIGFHEPEATHRWTDGAAVLPASLVAPLGQDIRVDVFLAETPLTYPLSATA